MLINQSIFKAYDFRGKYPEQMNEEIMERIGRAFVEFLQAKEILVGWDMRVSTPALSKAFMAGANKQGAKIIALGQISTDALYFASGRYGLAGAMITASHNPKEWNGVKFCRAGAEPIGEDSGLNEMKQLVLNQKFKDAPGGSIQAKERILEEFREHCWRFVDVKKIKPLKIVVDAGNGMAGKLVPAIFNGLPCEIVPLYFDLDGNFPNHPASPIEKVNNADLMAKVKEVNADLGLAFDGDADRVFFIDENSEMLDSSFITALIAKKMLEKNSGEKIIYTVTVSRAVPETVEKNGGVALMTRVGHSFIKKLMKEENAIFGGEHSGHYYFRDNFRADSGIIAALIVIEMLSEARVKMSELIKEFQTYYRIEETNSTVSDKDAVVDKLKEKYSGHLMQEFDGVSFDFSDWWFNVRPSNTEPVLRLNLEAKTKEVMEEKAKEVLDVIHNPS
jgi:phosphomannomutase